MGSRIDHANRVLTSDLETHAALRAWTTIRASQVPREIRILKPERPGKCAVYRLPGVGPGGVSVIAKCGPVETLAFERMLYEEIFPELDAPTLTLFGTLDEQEEGRCWLFLGDAGEQDYAPHAAADRELAAEWLASIHNEGAKLPANAQARMPRKTAAYYRETLLQSLGAIQERLERQGLAVAAAHTLESVLALLARVESSWDEAEAVCARAPATIVHGDFSRKNARILETNGRKFLAMFDWETAGWGVPAIDLADFAPSTGRKELRSYQKRVRHWIAASDELGRLAELGRLFRVLCAINWEVHGLAYDSMDRSVERMSVYSGQLERVLAVLDWAGSRTAPSGEPTASWVG